MLAFPNASLEKTCDRLEISDEITEYNVSAYAEDFCSCSRCVRKCCADGFGVLEREKKCSRTVFRNFSDDVHVFENFNYFTASLSCPFYLLEPHVYPEDVFSLRPDGRLWFESAEKYKNVNEYCVDFVDTIGFTAFICFEDEVTTEKLYKRFNEISKFFLEELINDDKSQI